MMWNTEPGWPFPLTRRNTQGATSPWDMQKVIGPDSTLAEWWESELKLVWGMFINLCYSSSRRCPQQNWQMTDLWRISVERIRRMQEQEIMCFTMAIFSVHSILVFLFFLFFLSYNWGQSTLVCDVVFPLRPALYWPLLVGLWQHRVDPQLHHKSWTYISKMSKNNVNVLWINLSGLLIAHVYTLAVGYWMLTIGRLVED